MLVNLEVFDCLLNLLLPDNKNGRLVKKIDFFLFFLLRIIIAFWVFNSRIPILDRNVSFVKNNIVEIVQIIVK